jgi:type VI secretion system protein ImpM
MVGAGFFGKVTSHGDFVARRLAPSFQRPWDEWLQGGLRESRVALGETWLATYMNSPIWRFALAPGVCGDQGWAGLLMPSVDRVGRHFPLTIAATVTPPLACLMRHQAWFNRIEALALASLREDFSLDALDFDLCALGVPDSPDAPAPSGAVIAFDGRQPDLHALANAALQGRSLWWTDGSPRVAPCLVVCAGLPEPAAFTALLDGDWQAHGWGVNAGIAPARQ